MLSPNFSKLVFLVLGSVALQVKAAALQLVNTDLVSVTAGKFPIQSASTPSRLSSTVSLNTASIPWAPTEENLVVNTTVVQGETAFLGWIFTPTEGDFFFDGFSKNISITYTSPSGGDEVFVIGIDLGPQTNFCGVPPGFSGWGFPDTFELGTYTGKWIVEYGESTQPDVPVDEFSGCGPSPFTSTTVVIERTWEVVEAT